jgi:2-polyprenyl-6-methoxyphenol hydroxylase-like FAD-dependent oxidoreductase
MTATDVLVVGAGPAGLTMANVLAAQGVPFRIIDKKGGPVEESRALVLHAKTLELLDRLGLAVRAVDEGQRMGPFSFSAEANPPGGSLSSTSAPTTARPTPSRWSWSNTRPSDS